MVSTVNMKPMVHPFTADSDVAKGGLVIISPPPPPSRTIKFAVIALWE